LIPTLSYTLSAKTIRAVRWLKLCWPREEHYVQVLNEFVAVARRKLDKSWEEVRRALDILRVFCPEPVPLTVETHERAVHIAERYGYSIFDSLIIAAALDAGARTLYSEDMQDGQAIDGLTIRNPFS
jgi:predicted nucleic acid-binding protein